MGTRELRAAIGPVDPQALPPIRLTDAGTVRSAEQASPRYSFEETFRPYVYGQSRRSLRPLVSRDAA